MPKKGKGGTLGILASILLQNFEKKNGAPFGAIQNFSFFHLFQSQCRKKLG